MPSDLPRPRFRSLLAPLEAFFRLESASGVVLLGAAVLALLWANSPWASGLERLRTFPTLRGVPFEHVVNDGLMTLFFLLVGLELKRELAIGELSTLRRALLPAVAAAGGMVAPAAIYLALNPGASARGWGIPMATDIAFSLGCLRLMPGRMPRELVVFLTALAIFDDLGGIVVIALFYGTGIALPWLLASGAFTAAFAVWHRRGTPPLLADVLALVGLWILLHQAGIHPTLAGVAVGLAIPARGAEGESRGQFWVHLLHRAVAFTVVPLFGLLNAGLRLRGLPASDWTDPVTLGTGLGLVVGKQAGIFAVTALAVRLGLAPLPGNGRWRELHAVSVIAGVGFTVALFVADLAFPDSPALLSRAKLGILVGSGVAAALGLLLIRTLTPRKVT